MKKEHALRILDWCSIKRNTPFYALGEYAQSEVLAWAISCNYHVKKDSPYGRDQAFFNKLKKVAFH